MPRASTGGDPAARVEKVWRWPARGPWSTVTTMSSASRAGVQVAAEHYSFERYDDRWRWFSYWYQIREALRLAPRRVLEIGCGTGVFRSYLREQGIPVLSADLDESRQPDFLCDVSTLDATLPPGERFDVVAAFQVLEHVPFEMLQASLEGLARRAAPHALVSLPAHSFRLNLHFRLGGVHLSVGGRLPKPWPHRFDGQHHWELGCRHSVGQVTRLMEKYFEVVNRYAIPENPYHHMWILKSRLA